MPTKVSKRQIAVRGEEQRVGPDLSVDQMTQHQAL
jgi:hypothetical protein